MGKQIEKEILSFQNELVKRYKYKPIPIDLFNGNVREKYAAALPEWCRKDGDLEQSLFSTEGTKICSGYERIVIGDYGAFLEISPEQICRSHIVCQPGQEYRYQDERYAKNAKYIWMTTNDSSDCKIYLQKKTVTYADYVPGMYYVSPYEVFPQNQNKK